MTTTPMNTPSNPNPPATANIRNVQPFDAPKTAKKRGRPQGVTTEVGKAFMDWPFGEWIEYTVPEGEDTAAQANAIRNLAWRKKIGASVLTDRVREDLLHVLKYEKGTPTKG